MKSAFVPFFSILFSATMTSAAFGAETKTATKTEVKTQTKAAPKKAQNYEIQVVELKHQDTAVFKASSKIEHAGGVIGAAMNTVTDYLTKTKIVPTGAPFTRTFIFKDGMMQFESGYPVAKPITPSIEVVAGELPKGTAVTTVHVGSQSNSQAAYKALENWLKKNGKKASGAPWEVYVSDETVKPEDAKLQVFYPL